MLGFLSKDPGLMLFYDGKAENLENCFDSSEGIAFEHSNNPKEWHTVEISFYGRKATVSAPFLPNDVAVKCQGTDETETFGVKDVTQRVSAYVNAKATKDLISDINYGKRNEIFSIYKIVTFESKRYLVPRDQRNFLQFSQGDDDELALLTMLEFMQGFVRIDPINFKYQKSIQALPLGKAWHFELKSNLYKDKYGTDKVVVNHNYTINLRKIMFYDQFKEFENSGLLQSWQYKVIKYMAKVMYFVAPRRSGKSYVLAYIALRELFMQSFKPEVRERPLTVLYLSLNKGLNKQIKRYMDKMIQRMAKTEQQKAIFKEMLVWDNQNSTYELRSDGEVIGQIIFLTAQGDDPGIGYPGDIVIIDEMFKIPKEHKEGLDAICDGEDARFFGASTMYKDSTKGWAWEEMTRIEGGMKDLRSKNDEIIYERGSTLEKAPANYVSYMDLAKKSEWGVEDKIDYQKLVNRYWERNNEVSIRFTVDDIDRHVQSGRAERWKKKYLAINDYLRYVTELYSRFPHEGAVFKYRNCLRDPSKMNLSGNKYAVLSNDPALSPETADKCACCLVTYDEFNNKLCVNLTKNLTKTGRAKAPAQEILQLAKEWDKYGKNVNPSVSYDPNNLEYNLYHQSQNAGKNLHIVGDATATQKSIWELYNEYGVNQHATISYRGNQMAKQSAYDTRNRDVSKAEMVATVIEIIDNGWLWINADLMGLRAELNAFQKIGDKDVYEGVGETDDEVNAMMIGLYYLYKIIGVQKLLTQEHTPQITEGMDKEEKKVIGRLIKLREDAEKAKQEYITANNTYYSNFVY